MIYIMLTKNLIKNKRDRITIPLDLLLEKMVVGLVGIKRGYWANVSWYNIV